MGKHTGDLYIQAFSNDHLTSSETYGIHDDLFYDSMINSVKNAWGIDSGMTVSSDSTGTTISSSTTKYMKLPVSESSFAMEWDYISGTGNDGLGVQTWNGTTWVSYGSRLLSSQKYIIEGASRQEITYSKTSNIHCKYVVNGNSHSFYVDDTLVGTVTKKSASGTLYIGFYVSGNTTSQKIKNVEIKPL